MLPAFFGFITDTLSVRGPEGQNDDRQPVYFDGFVRDISTRSDGSAGNPDKKVRKGSSLRLTYF